MKHPRFYKRTIHRRSGFSPAKSLFPPICCRAEALHRILFLYPPYFQTASCPLPHTGLRFPPARCGGKIRSVPHPAAKPQKSRPKRAAGDLTVMAAGFRRQFARGGTRGAFFLRMRPVVFGSVRPVFVGRSPCGAARAAGAARANAAAAIRAARLFCFMVPTPSVVGGKGRMIRAGGVLFRKAG